MLGECGVVCNAVESGRVELGEGRVGVLAMEAFLEAVDPVGVSKKWEEGR